MAQDLIYNSDYSPDHVDLYQNSGENDDSFYLEDFNLLKDVTRSKKFYLKKRSPDEVKFNELEDGFLERFTDGDSDSEEEKIIQVVWSEDDATQNKLVRFVESLDSKKSNSKFTLNMLDEERAPPEIDLCEGEEVKGRFLEVKDSLEVIATSSRNIHGSDWDFSVEEDNELVNSIWRKSDSPWTSSLQIEIGKLPSQADQETVLQVLDDGAQGRISVRDVTECLGNLLEKADLECGPSKKVSFHAVHSKSCLSKESLSQTSSHSTKSAPQKKVSFHTEFDEFSEILDDAEKLRKVSIYELAFDDDCSPTESGKIKKSVSFHDSVEFHKTNKIKDDNSADDSSSVGGTVDTDSMSSVERSSSSEKHRDVMFHSSEDKAGIDIVSSNFSLPESFLMHTGFNDNFNEVMECTDFSDHPHSSAQDDRNVQIHIIKFLNSQMNMNMNGRGLENIEKIQLDYSEGTDKLYECAKEIILDTEENLKDENNEESYNEKVQFIKDLIEKNLNKRLDERDNLEELMRSDQDMDCISKTFNLFYENCRDMIDVDSLSKSLGLAMAFQEFNPTDLQLDSRAEQNYSSTVETDNEKVKTPPENAHASGKKVWNDEEYLSADSESEIKNSI